MSNQQMNIINPATEEIIATLKKDNTETVAKKLKTLQEGQPLWKN